MTKLGALCFALTQSLIERELTTKKRVFHKNFFCLIDSKTSQTMDTDNNNVAEEGWGFATKALHTKLTK